MRSTFAGSRSGRSGFFLGHDGCLTQRNVDICFHIYIYTHIIHIYTVYIYNINISTCVYIYIHTRTCIHEYIRIYI